MAEAGAAVLIEDEDLTGKLLRSTVEEILRDFDGRARMAAASRALAKPDAARDVASEILKAIEK
jgi:UDP-N-acetylglucosamine--N-acetylmuramyl-(pentapeptide) pyrophosphoryl-undecaprenol N-acetylglucosamine transferase